MLALCSVRFPNQKGLGCRMKWLEHNSATNSLLNKYKASDFIIGTTFTASF